MNIRQHKILDAILSFVPGEGWTQRAFDLGTAKVSMSAAEGRKFFVRGIDDAVAAFHLSIDEAMQERIKAKRNFYTLRVREKITFAVRVRLEAVEEHRDAMRRLLVWAMIPQHIRDATKQLWQIADAIWIAAGDKATDYNYYTKRLLLIAVMKSTLSFWLNDESEGRRDTWDFLDRRIADVMMLGKGINAAQAVGISDIASLLRARFS